MATDRRENFSAEERLTRTEALELILGNLKGDEAIIATTGKTGRELFTIADRPNHLYVVGGMGTASAIGFGVAHALPHQPVVVIDGDGAALMKMGSLATIGFHQPENFLHIILDNEAHDSTGGQQTASSVVRFAQVAAAANYRSAFALDRREDIGEAVRDLARASRAVASARENSSRVAGKTWPPHRETARSEGPVLGLSPLQNAMNDPLLFTPGPLTTSATVKAAMQRDLGSRDTEFINLVARIRRELLEIAGVSQESGYETVLMQGSGTFGIEAVLSSVIPPEGRLLILANGAYGERMVQIAERLKIPFHAQRWPENESPNPATVAQLLAETPTTTHVAMVHLETTTGILNPLDEIARIVREHGCRFIIDAMSSFGGVPLDLAALQPDYLISSANKCLESVPGFSFVIAKRTALEATAGYARSVSLDLLAQWQASSATGSSASRHRRTSCSPLRRPSRSCARKGAWRRGPSVTARIARR